MITYEDLLRKYPTQLTISEGLANHFQVDSLDDHVEAMDMEADLFDFMETMTGQRLEGQDQMAFDFSNYLTMEDKFFKPFLEKAGAEDVHFSTGDKDSFGPLTRIVSFTVNGRRFTGMYG